MKLPLPTACFALLALGCLLAPMSLRAQLNISAEVRPRAELRDGFKTPSSDGFAPAFFVEQRSRLYVDYAEPRYKLRFALQDVRLWGQVPQIFKQDVGTSFLSEAWGQFELTEKLSVKVGRQMLSYDDQRFLGGLEWAQQGRRHDALLFVHEAATAKLHVGLAFNSDDDTPEPALLQGPAANFYTTPGNYKALQFAWFHKDFADERGGISVLALNATLQNPDTSTSNKQTFGLVPRYTVGKVGLAANLYVQTGKVGAASVNAFLVSLDATVPTAVTPITAGFEYISGKDADDTSTDIRAFSPDYGTNHAFNGLMDYFFVGPANGNVGVLDIYAKTKFSLGEKTDLLVHGHEFLTGSKQFSAEGGEELSRPLGAELDLVLVRRLLPGVTFHLGYSHLFGTDTLTSVRAGNRKQNNWAWSMLTFKPNLFTYTKPVEEPEG